MPKKFSWSFSSKNGIISPKVRGWKETPTNPIRRYKPKVVKEYYLETLNANFKPGFIGQTVNFFDTCVIKERKNDQGSTLIDALKVTEFCESIMK